VRTTDDDDDTLNSMHNEVRAGEDVVAAEATQSAEGVSAERLTDLYPVCSAPAAIADGAS